MFPLLSVLLVAPGHAPRFATLARRFACARVDYFVDNAALGAQKRAGRHHGMLGGLRALLSIHLRQEADVLRMNDFVALILAPGQHAQLAVGGASGGVGTACDGANIDRFDVLPAWRLGRQSRGSLDVGVRYVY